MKCPKCGFVSFPGLNECRKCGHSFVTTEQQEAASLTSVAPCQISGPLTPPAPSDKFSERVANFRRRRATLRDDEHNEASLAFDFSTASRLAPSEAARDPAQLSPAEEAFDQVFAERATGVSPQAKLESLHLDQRPKEAASRMASKEPSGGSFAAPAVRDSRVIQFGEIQFRLQKPVMDYEFPEVISAPLGSRFAAGLIDTLILAASGCFFVILFNAVGGRFSKTPVDVGVALFITAFWLFIYFAAFGVMTGRTPGQAALGLEIRNLDGEPPTAAESLWRAFGYLVSISALALGLIWTALDSDGMGWQDHISGTLPSRVERPE
ncbi:MAG: RDD family protein [Terriglobia bacterium]